VIHFALYGEAYRAVRLWPRIHRIRETIDDGRDRQCGEPLLISACLREVGDGTDPTISPLRRSKAFPSLVELSFLATVLASVVYFQDCIRSR
jgi:hypothetical protein